MTSERPGSAYSNEMASDVAIRYFRDGEEEAVLRLLQDSFPVWPPIPVSAPPIEHLRWKMRLAESDERRHKVAELDGRIVGVMLGWSRPALLRGRAVLCGAGSDACVHPDYRERGVMLAMRMFEYEARSRLALNVVGRTTHPGMVHMRQYISDPRGSFGNRVERFVRPLDLPASGMDPGPGIAIKDVTSFDERTDAFWQEACRSFEFIMTRDRSYLSWRYADRRAGNFTIKIAEEGNDLAGLIVLCTDAAGERGIVADLLALPNRADVVRTLLREALTWARAAALREAVGSLPEHHPYRAALDAEGFILKRNRHVTAYRVTGAVPEEELAFLQDPRATIHITRGDGDTV